MSSREAFKARSDLDRIPALRENPKDPRVNSSSLNQAFSGDAAAPDSRGLQMVAARRFLQLL
jgi:hypothetical protein